jgi:hypothetical protein
VSVAAGVVGVTIEWPVGNRALRRHPA